MNFRTMSAFENVPVRYDTIVLDEEAAATRKLVAAGVESFNRNGRRFDAAD